MVKILNNCCSPAYLDTLKNVAIESDNWNMWNPGDASIEDKFLKLNIASPNGIKEPLLAGLAMGLLVQIHEAGGQDLFIPNIYFCGISIKDKHRPDNIHSDYKENSPIVKILGILNSDWKEEWGGSFFCDGTSNYIKPTSFCIFDGSKPHGAEEIFTDKKRFAIDFSVFKDQQSLERHFEKQQKHQRKI